MRIEIRELLAVTLLLGVLAVSSRILASNSVNPRLYVTNSLGDDISVIDLQTLKVIADIKVGKKVHGVCGPSDGRHVFTTIESENALKVIDTGSQQIVATIHLTGTPNQCASTPDGRYVAVPIHTNEIDIVDVAQKKIVKVLPIQVPHNCYNSGNNSDMYCSSTAADEIDRIDLGTMEYSGKIPVGGIPRPYAVSRDEKMMYVALTAFHGFAAVDLANGNKIDRVQLPGPSVATICEKLEHRTPTHGLELSPDGKQLWVTSLSDNGVYLYDLATKKISKQIPTGTCPNWITVSPDGQYVMVSNSASDDASVIDTRTRREIARIKVGNGPKRLLAVNVPAS